MISIIFDLDDTLYFQKAQFILATKAITPSLNEQEIDHLYNAFQHSSEKAYVRRERGEINLDEMRLIRIKQAYEAIKMTVTEKVCQDWQQAYQYEQQHIKLAAEVKVLLDYCQSQPIDMGIITNGPSDHQRMKIKALGLAKWFKEDRILVSGDIGISKPDRRIFETMAAKLPSDISECYYIGDNPVNDVKGASEAGWRPIWLNVKGDTLSLKETVKEVKSHRELLSYLKELIGNNQA